MAEERGYPGSRAYELITRKLGVPSRLVEKRVSVGTSVTEVLPNNPRRIMWVVVNRATTNGAIGFAYDLSYDNGLILGANGGTACMTIDEDSEAVCYPVYGILANGTGVFYILEVEGL